MIHSLTETQRVIVELAAANRLVVVVRPRTSKVRSFSIRAAIVTQAIPHEEDRGRIGVVAIAMALAVDVVKFGSRLKTPMESYQLEPTLLGLQLLGHEARPQSVEAH